MRRTAPRRAATDSRTAQEWLQEELTRSGRAIDPDAARLLVSRAGHDITKLRGDVERLLLFTEGRKRISADDVMEVVADEQTVDDDWAVINAIADGRPCAGPRRDRAPLRPRRLAASTARAVAMVGVLAAGGGRRVPREAGD